MPGNVSDYLVWCHGGGAIGIQLVEARDVAKQPTLPKTPPYNKKLSNLKYQLCSVLHNIILHLFSPSWLGLAISSVSTLY